MNVITSPADFEQLFKTPFEAKKIIYSVKNDFFQEDLIQKDRTEEQQLTIDVDIATNDDMSYFPCAVYHCTARFNSVEEYQLHYNSIHSFICSVCNKSFPTNNILEVHLQENHDSYNAAAAAKYGARFQCFVEGCDLYFTSPSKRNSHIINVHNYPPDFKFYRLRPRQNKAEKMNITSEDQAQDTVMSKKQKSKTQVPKTVCFGRGAARAFSRTPRNTKDISMKELSEAL